MSPWAAARQAPLSFTISRTFLKLRSTELVMPSPSHPLPSPSPPAFNLSPASGSFPVSHLSVLGAQVLDLQLQHLLDYPTLIYLTLKFVFLFFGLVLDPFISLSCFQSVDFKFIILKTFLLAQQLGLLSSTTGGMDSIPLVRELRSCMLHGMAKKKGGGIY